MRTPSTADGAGADREPATRTPNEGQTRANVKGETAPRLPHEHDESSDSGSAAPPDPLMRQAGKDAASGRPSTDRGEVTDELYQRTLRDQGRGG